MEPSHSETSSETFSAEYVRELQESLNWHAAILTVLLQEAGGVVEVEAKDLEGIQLNRAKAQVTYDGERDVYTIEGLYTEDDKA